MNPAQAAESASTEKTESIDLAIGTMQWLYLLYAPANLPVHAPLLLAFHPSGSSGAQMRMMSSAVLERIARASGFAIACPDGFEGHFNDCRRAASYGARSRNIDDVGFARATTVAKALTLLPYRGYAAFACG